MNSLSVKKRELATYLVNVKLIKPFGITLTLIVPPIAILLHFVNWLKQSIFGINHDTINLLQFSIEKTLVIFPDYLVY